MARGAEGCGDVHEVEVEMEGVGWSGVGEKRKGVRKKKGRQQQ